MFKLSVSPSYTARVTVDLPGGGSASFDAKFRRLSQTDLDAMMKRVQSEDIDDEAIVDAVLLGWDGVEDADGTPLPFTEENKARVLDVVPVRGTVVRAFFESLAKAKAKN